MEYQKFWMVWNPLGRSPTHRHESRQSAIIEAERLASLYDGDFHVLESLGSCRKVSVRWSKPNQALDDGIPF